MNNPIQGHNRIGIPTKAKTLTDSGYESSKHGPLWRQCKQNLENGNEASEVDFLAELRIVLHQHHDESLHRL